MNKIEVKEVESTSYVAKQEIVPEGATQNSFMVFINQRHEDFDRLSLLTRDLREEEEGWWQSTTFDQLTQHTLEILDTIRMDYGWADKQGNREKRRNFEQAKKKMAALVFKSRKELSLKDFFTDVPRYKNRSPQQVKELGEATKDLNKFSQEYHGAIEAITTPLREVRQTLYGEFRIYLQQDYKHLFDFAAFLSEKEHVASREAIRSFLVGIAQEEQEATKNGKKGAIEEASQQWNGWVSSGLRDEVFLLWTQNLWASMSFSGKVEGGLVNVEMDKSFLEFARFLIEVAKTFMPEDDIGQLTLEDTQQVLKRISDINRWPSVLRNAYINFAKARIGSAVKDIRQSLLEYRQKELLPPADIIFDRTLAPTKRKQRAPKGNGANVVAESTPVEEANKPYSLGILVRVGDVYQVQVMTEEEITTRMRKDAARIARKDPTLVEDIRRLYKTAREDPYANTIGLKTITWKHITVDHKEFAYRSFDPRKRIGLELTHKDLYDFRLVYAVDKRNHVVIIDGLYGHDEYMSKFDMN